MYEKTDKRRIYELIGMYLAGKIDEPTFCDEFYYSYDLEIDPDILSEQESRAFSELGKIASRFSEFEEDIKKHPGVYYTRDDLRKKIIDTKEMLKQSFDEFKRHHHSDADV